MAEEHTRRQHAPLARDQRDALWKWRWLGWRRSTPAFKLSLVLLCSAALLLLGKALRLF